MIVRVGLSGEDRGYRWNDEMLVVAALAQQSENERVDFERKF